MLSSRRALEEDRPAIWYWWNGSTSGVWIELLVLNLCRFC
jgi:hypothetical protein